MKHWSVGELQRGGEVVEYMVGRTSRSQAYAVVIKPGETAREENDQHPNSDQWLYVVSGCGCALVQGQPIQVSTGSLLLIEAGERHEITNTGRDTLLTVNVFAPPLD